MAGRADDTGRDEAATATVPDERDGVPVEKRGAVAKDEAGGPGTLSVRVSTLVRGAVIGLPMLAVIVLGALLWRRAAISPNGTTVRPPSGVPNSWPPITPSVPPR